jgi:hypothetical protein
MAMSASCSRFPRSGLHRSSPPNADDRRHLPRVRGILSPRERSFGWSLRSRFVGPRRFRRPRHRARSGTSRSSDRDRPRHECTARPVPKGLDGWRPLRSRTSGALSSRESHATEGSRSPGLERSLTLRAYRALPSPAGRGGGGAPEQRYFLFRTRSERELFPTVGVRSFG